MTEKVIPTCRYGHGPLHEEVGLTHDTWALNGINMTINADSKAKTMVTNGRGYSVRVFCCKTCGYIELFDDEISK